MTMRAAIRQSLQVASLPLLLLFGGCSHLLGTVGVFGLNKGCTLYGSAAEIEMAESLGRKWTFDAEKCQIILEPVQENTDGVPEETNNDVEDKPESADSGSDSPDSVYSDVVRRIREEADGGR